MARRARDQDFLMWTGSSEKSRRRRQASTLAEPFYPGLLE